MLEQRMANWPLLWGPMNNARVMHLARIPAFSREQLPVDGSGTAINAQRGNHGPSQRIVVELSDPPKAWYQMPGGSSGNPGSVHYDDLLNEWYTDTYREVRFLGSVREGVDLGFPKTTITP
jgi:penicillin amidase